MFIKLRVVFFENVFLYEIILFNNKIVNVIFNLLLKRCIIIFYCMYRSYIYYLINNVFNIVFLFIVYFLYGDRGLEFFWEKGVICCIFVVIIVGVFNVNYFIDKL